MSLGAHIDFTSLESRTAAMRQLAMIEERIKNLAAAAMRARLMGKSHEAMAAQSEISDLGMRQRHIEMNLSRVLPLSGVGAFGASNRPSAQSVLNRETKETAALASRRAELVAKVRTLEDRQRSQKKELDKLGVLEIGKKSYLKSEIEERTKAISRTVNEIKELDKKISVQAGDLKEAQGLATNPAAMAASLTVKIASLAAMEKGREATLSALNKSIKGLEADLERAGAMDFAKKKYIKERLEVKGDAKSREIKELGKIRSQIKELQEDLGRAKTYSQTSSSKGHTVVTPTKIITATGMTKVLGTNERLRIDSLSTKIAELDNKRDMAQVSITRRLNDPKSDAGAIIKLMESASAAGMEIRSLQFELDTLKSGEAAARGLRLRNDKDRVVAVRARLEQVHKSKVRDVRPVLTHLRNYLDKCTSLVQSSTLSNLVQVKKGIALPIWRKISASQLSNRKRQLSLKPQAPVPTLDTMKALSAAFAQAIPPKNGEKPEDYVARLKLYIARGTVVAANAAADGAPKQEAIATAVKEVVVQDAPALEEEAKNKVQAPAGEESVASHVDAASSAIVEAATMAQPQLMAQAAPADSTTNTEPNTQVVPTTVEAAVAEADAETKVASAPEADDSRPWYMKPSGMALIGVAALIGYKALSSKD